MAAWPVSDLVGSDTLALPPRGTRGLASGFGPWGRFPARLDRIPTMTFTMSMTQIIPLWAIGGLQLTWGTMDLVGSICITGENT